jgi:predicted naringenin-chalcone synthase
LAEIISIATAVPEYCHRQKDILSFMQNAYSLDEIEKRKLSFLYHQSNIEKRYSVIGDFSLPREEWQFLSQLDNSFPSLEKRLELYKKEALPLSVNAIKRCIDGHIKPSAITHLITVSCTGMSAPGLDLEIMEAMNLQQNIFRTSVNFMGCYAAIHAMKIADMICKTNENANVIIVATELCTLHFQKEYTLDNAASSLLFSDGSAALLMSNNFENKNSVSVNSFHSAISFKGKQDMAWELSSKGFLMTLSGYIPQLIEEDIFTLVNENLKKNNLQKEDITHWCIHPGGRKIIDTIQKKLSLCECALNHSRNVLRNYGNMSSPTILFVLKEMMDDLKNNAKPANIFGVAFGPGLTMETFLASSK